MLVFLVGYLEYTLAIYRYLFDSCVVENKVSWRDTFFYSVNFFSPLERILLVQFGEEQDLHYI